MRALIFTIAILAFRQNIIAQSERSAECPAISVTGPAGITQPGDTMTFAAISQVENAKPGDFRWTVSAGRIIHGQGTPKIDVQTPREMNHTIVTALVEVSGLPKNCPNTASVPAAVSSGFHPVNIDEFGKLPKNDVRGRLDNFLNELLGNRDHIGFIVLRLPTGKAHQGRFQRRLNLIRYHLFNVRKFPKQRIVIRSERGEMEHTVLWRSARENVSYFCPSGVIH
jgi:hypothetical protein